MSKSPIVNVGNTERTIAGALGMIVLFSAIRHGSLARLLVATCCFYRYTTGNCKGYEMLGISTCAMKKGRP